jgi:V/A-type H+-transporting ATPase subunit C
LPRIRDSRYIYAVSRIRVIENRLLGQSEIERMADAKTPEQALKILTEAGYGRHTAEAVTPADFEKLLEEEHRRLYALLREISPDPGVFDIFLQPYDFHNIKVLLKAEFTGVEEYNRLLTNKGSMEVEKLRAILRDRQLYDMPPVVGEAVKEAIAELNHTRDPQTVDLILDRACYRRMREMADSTDSRFLRNFIAATVDLLNVQIVLRLKSLKKNNEFARRTILPGGHIKPEVLLEVAEESMERFETVLRDTPYRAAAARLFKNYGKPGGKALPEQLSDDFTLAYTIIGRQKISGIEPLIGYMLNKEAELRNIRTIMVGKLNGISPDRIKERLRTVYA